MIPGLYSKPVLRRASDKLRGSKDEDLAQVREMLREILLDGWDNKQATILLTEEE